MEQRVIIIGYSGSGKSTLAQILGNKYRGDVLHLDCVHWLPGWQERNSAEMHKIVSDFLDTHDSWVIDGNYQSACYDRRMEEATQIIFLDFPVYICLFRVIRRYFANCGKTRESMAVGCDEKIDREFLWWIVYKGRDRVHRERYQKVCKEYEEKAVVLKNPKQVKKFLNRI